MLELELELVGSEEEWAGGARLTWGPYLVLMYDFLEM